MRAYLTRVWDTVAGLAAARVKDETELARRVTARLETLSWGQALRLVVGVYSTRVAVFTVRQLRGGGGGGGRRHWVKCIGKGNGDTRRCILIKRRRDMGQTGRCRGRATTVGHDLTKRQK